MNNQESKQSSTNSLVNSYTAASSNTTQASATQMNTVNTTSANNVVNTTNTTNTQKSNQTIIGVFGSRSNAENAVNALRQQGFTTEEINIISKKQENDDDSGNDSDDDIFDGTLTGSTLGGIGGLLLGAGALAIPGIGPIIAAGPIAGAISGAIAGGITGGLIDWGIPADESHHYEQEVVQGSILAIIRTDVAKVNSVAQILRQNGAKEVKSHSK
ncbi:hypothetical protein [Pelosinus sp. sgz500959]|uniref:hypothetical protein n=1 Tax=Pelosinus sp. sgz500959 TaxID=3242472 RepID=UPI00366F92F0